MQPLRLLSPPPVPPAPPTALPGVSPATLGALPAPLYPRTLHRGHIKQDRLQLKCASKTFWGFVEDLLVLTYSFTKDHSAPTCTVTMLNTVGADLQRCPCLSELPPSQSLIPGAVPRGLLGPRASLCHGLPPCRNSQPSHSIQMHVSKGFAASPLGYQNEQGQNQTPGPRLVLQGLPAQEVAAPSFSCSNHNPGEEAEYARTQGRKGAGRSVTQGQGGRDGSERGYSQSGRTLAHSERKGLP